MPGKVIIVQGGQYGSEGKGQVCAFLDRERGGINHHVRTGSINAGHTIVHKGHQYKMQQIPVGWVNPNATLYIGAGAYVHLPTLGREVADIAAQTGEDIRRRLIVDATAYVQTDGHADQAAAAGRHLTIGATGKGCAEAVIEKIRDRGASQSPALFGTYLFSTGYRVGDVSNLLNRALDFGYDILIEGTQGTLLDIHHGSYPYTTSRMTTSAAWLAECGISPRRRIETNLVIRTFPIRVAGNSGPLPDEITWPQLWRLWRGHANAPQVSEAAIAAFEARVTAAAGLSEFATRHPRLTPADRWQHRAALSRAQSEALTALSEDEPELHAQILPAIEMTTVTRKPRRIAQFNIDDILRACRIEEPSYLTVTFINYLFPGTWLGPEDNSNHIHWGEAAAWMDWLAHLTGIPVRYYSTGPGMEGLRSRS